MGLSLGQVFNDGVMGREPQGSFGGWKEKVLGIVEGVPGRGVETTVPHECRVEGDVQRLWTAPLIERAAPSGTDHQVTLHPDGNGYAIAKSEGGCMAAGASVVIVETRDGVGPQHLAHFGKPRVNLSPELLLQGRFHLTRELELREGRYQLRVNALCPSIVIAL